jgi:glycosyltransferase involved in cell wall biosynthesis
MKISIVIPSSNEAEYVEKLTDFIKNNSAPDNIEEIIIVETLSTKRMVKVAEKNHAKLYYNLSGNSLSQMEMGAFQAKGEIIYFIKPGCIPPLGFDKRIKKYIQEKQSMGCFDYEIDVSDALFVKIYKRICSFIFKNNFQTNSFFVLSKLYYQSGGLKKHNSYVKLKKQVLLSEN